MKIIHVYALNDPLCRRLIYWPFPSTNSGEPPFIHYFECKTSKKQSVPRALNLSGSAWGREITQKHRQQFPQSCLCSTVIIQLEVGLKHWIAWPTWVLLRSQQGYTQRQGKNTKTKIEITLCEVSQTHSPYTWAGKVRDQLEQQLLSITLHGIVSWHWVLCVRYSQYLSLIRWPWW